MDLQPLETDCEWTAADMADPALWTEVLTPGELAEIDAAVMLNRGRDLLEVGKADFPLPTLSARLKTIENELMNGRGFVRIRGVDRERYDNDDMCLIYWGIGAHLG
ncbi:MAG: Taurine catabolism dioxygenase TauD/TfdA [Caulobacter sp.]|nr:Taurine catabolism dioxygenase TauD/TfdA [Caulobacter sp.]